MGTGRMNRDLRLRRQRQHGDRNGVLINLRHFSTGIAVAIGATGVPGRPAYRC